MKIEFSLKNIVLAAIVSIITVFIIFFLFNLKLIDQKITKIEEQYVEKIIGNNIDTIANLFYFEFDDSLQTLLNSIKENVEEVEQIRIVKELPHAKNAKDGMLVYPLQYQGKTVGYLQVKYRLVFKDVFWKRYQTAGIFIIVAFFFFLAFILYYLYSKISSIDVLAARVQNIDLSHIRKIGAPDSFKEIHTITKSINTMLTAIKENFQKIYIQEKHLQEAQKIAHLSSWEYDLQTGEFSCSDELYRTLGVDASVAMQWEDFLSYFEEKERNRFLAMLERVQKSGISAENVYLFQIYGKTKYLKIIIKYRKTKQEEKFIGIALDVTEEVEAKKKVEFLAYHDPLTALPNRYALQMRLKELAKNQQKRFGVVFIDIDDFKFINDSYGHTFGDEFLMQLAKALVALNITSDIFRIGGDEFVLIVENFESKKELSAYAEQILEKIATEYEVEGVKFFVTCSIGICIYPDDSEKVEDLLTNADLAMYEAKKEGKNRYRFFDEKMKERFERYNTIAHYLQESLQKRDEILLYFQPKLNFETLKVESAEVLVRWNHPELGFVFPDTFIPVAERSDLIIELDHYILKRSFESLEQWQQDPLLSKLYLSVNISGREFYDPHFIDYLKELLQTHPIDPSKIEIEITETVSMEDAEFTKKTLKEIKSLGFRIALDDFGTGYSSLNYLKQIPFDTLKIDKSFVQDIDKDEDDLKIVTLIINIAKSFSKETVAEGVETKRHEEILRDLACNMAQGYLYSKAVDKEQFRIFVNQQNSSSA